LQKRKYVSSSSNDSTPRQTEHLRGGAIPAGNSSEAWTTSVRLSPQVSQKYGARHDTGVACPKRLATAFAERTSAYGISSSVTQRTAVSCPMAVTHDGCRWS